jgi:predicted RNase H-like HicB family nuclease
LDQEHLHKGWHEQGGRVMRYAIVVEEGESNYSAYVPDLSGCVAAGKTREDVRQLIAEAIEFHLEGLQEDGEPIRLD